MTCLSFASSAKSDGRFRGHVELEADVFFVGQGFDDGLHLREGFGEGEGGGHQFHPAGFDLGQIENVIDELEEMASAGEDVVAVFELAGVQVAKSFVGEDFRETHDGIKGRAQLVAHVRQELALGAIGGFGGFFGVLEDGFGQAPLGHVQKDAVGAQDTAARLGGQGAVMQPDPSSVFAAELVFDVELLAVGEKPAVGLADGRRVLRMDAIHPKLAAVGQEFPGSEAEHVGGVGADVKEVPVGIGGPDHVGNMIDERTVFFLVRPQGLLGLFALSNVLNDRLKLACVVAILKQAPDAVLMPDLTMVWGREAVIKGNNRLVGREGVDVAERNGGILSGEGLEEVGSDQFVAGFAPEAAEGVVDEGEQTVRSEAANQIRLIFHHGPEALSLSETARSAARRSAAAAASNILVTARMPM